MSNRTDFGRLVAELVRAGDVTAGAAVRVETELHNACVAGQEGGGCLCWSCAPPTHCAGEHSYYQARCERCGKYASGADVIEGFRRFRAEMETLGFEPFKDAFCEHGRLVTRDCKKCDDSDGLG